MTSITAPSRLWQPTAITAGVGLVVLFLVAQFPEICPAVSPAPPSCAPDARESSALLGAAIIVSVAAAGIGVTYVVPTKLRIGMLRVAMIAVAIASLVAVVMTVLASGFIL